METPWKISDLGGSEDEDVDVPKLEELLTQDSGWKYLLLLMVQKSHSQPPGMYKTCK